jgi:prepilin-type N-terminal cleavage/methylation domain-containing protein
MRDNRGFTLIELLIVIVILCILAAMAIPKISNTRDKSHFATMESDLKNLASQQEIYYADERSYTAEKSDLAFMSSRDVTISINVDPGGWSATATHVALGPSEGCSIYHGSIPALSFLVTPSGPDEVVCTR